MGGSAVRSIVKQGNDNYEVSVGGRRIENWHEYIDKKASNNIVSNSLNEVKFVKVDINSANELEEIIPQYDIIVNTAGMIKIITDIIA